eukprot:gene3739-4312_t
MSVTMSAVNAINYVPITTVVLEEEAQGAGSMPIISCKDTNEKAMKIVAQAAVAGGICCIEDLNMSVDFQAVQRLFDMLLCDEELAKALNETYPKRGVYKSAALKRANVDQKFTIDLSLARLSLIPADLRARLGEDFDSVVDFFSAVHAKLLPLLLEATSSIVGVDLAPLHSQNNVNYRLCDYPTRQTLATAEDGHPRCNEHRDYGTVTILFQNNESGLEYQTASGQWIPVPANAGRLLSGGQIVAVNHRVLRTTARRNTAVLFVAPNLDVPLTPLCPVVASSYNSRVIDGSISIEEFKETTGRKWRAREGNETLADGENPSHQQSVFEFLHSTTTN